MNLNCGLNKNHLVVEKPVIFKCTNEDQNQKACLNCVIKQCDYSGGFKCKLCAGEHKIDSLIKSDFKIQSLPNESLEGTAKNLVLNGTKLNSDLKEKLVDKNVKRLFGKIVEFIEQDLIIRVESLKFEFDDLERKLNSKIDSYRSKQIEKNQIYKLKSLHSKNQNISSHILLEKCKLYEENLKNLNEIVNLKISKSTHKDKKYVNSNIPTKAMIGFLSGSFSSLTIDKCISLTPKITIVDLSCFIKSACGLTEVYNGKKNSLALTDYASNDIKVMRKYDSFSLRDVDILCIDRFRMNKFKSYYAICSSYDLNSLTGLEDKSDSLYACDMELHRVLIFDQNLTRIKRIISGIPCGDDPVEEFECPRDIYYYDNFIYVLDQGKLVVNIFHKNGDFYKNFYFNDSLRDNLIQNPWSVRVGADRIFIIDWKECVYVFNFEFELKNVIQIESVYSMCLVNDFQKENIFVFFHCENGQFSGYRFLVGKNSTEPELVYKNIFKNLKYRSEFMIFSSSQKFVLSLGWAKSLALIDFS